MPGEASVGANSSLSVAIKPCVTLRARRHTRDPATTTAMHDALMWFGWDPVLAKHDYRNGHATDTQITAWPLADRHLESRRITTRKQMPHWEKSLNAFVITDANDS